MKVGRCKREEGGRLGIKPRRRSGRRRGMRGCLESVNVRFSIGEADAMRRGFWNVALLRSVSVNLAELRRAPSEGGWEYVKVV